MPNVHMNISDMTFDQVVGIIKDLSTCIDNYFYVRDLKSKRMYFSQKIVDRFRLLGNEYDDCDEANESVVYPDDLYLLQEDIELMESGEKSNHSLQYRWLDKDSQIVWIHCTGEIVHDTEGKPLFLLGSITEIGNKSIADDVSGLKGEVMLREDYNKLISAGKTGHVIRFGIDNFKEINENHGNSYGDMVLRQTAGCIMKVVGGGRYVYRLNGDEYIYLSFDGATEESTVKIYDELSYAINDFIIRNGYDVFFTMSAGIVDIHELEQTNYESVMRRSDFALNEAKKRGKNQYYFFKSEEYAAFRERRKLLNNLRRSISEDFDGFSANYQPIIDHKTGKIRGAETLLRYCDIEGRTIPPVEFIPVLEEQGLIIPAGRWAISQAMDMCKRMQKILPGFMVSVNVSYVQIAKSNVLDLLIRQKQKIDLPDGTFIVELTESGEIECNERFVEFRNRLKENGIGLALDDFGTGYSNFHYLYNLRPDTMKIDRSFTVGAINNEYEMKLLGYMSDMAHSIGLDIVIEGVETAEELEKISQVSPDYIQGFYYGKPMPEENLIEFVKKYKGE